MRRGQAMLETVLAVLFITGTFLVLFRLSRLLTGKILVEHAAMRVARARAVGLNDFMCLKSARLAVIPIAGQRTWPNGENAIDEAGERARVPVYLQAATEAIARGLLDYEDWSALTVKPGDGTDSKVEFAGDFNLTGRAGVESHCPLYLLDSGQ